MSHAARRLRPISRWISTVRPLCLPRGRLAVDPLRRRAGQHRVLGRDPALAAAAHPARHVVVDARRAQHAGLAERHETRAVGHLGEVALERDRAQLVGGAAVGAGHPSACPSDPVGRRRGDPRRSVWSSSGPSSRAAEARGTCSTSPLDRKRWLPAARRRRAAGRARPSTLARGERRLVGRADERDARPITSPMTSGEERIVGAAEQQGVDVGGADGASSRSASTVTSSPVVMAALDELDEARAGGDVRIDVDAGRPAAVATACT